MAVGLFLVASCGDSGVERDDYARGANAVCADAVDRMDALIAPVFTSYLPTIGEEPTDEELMGLYARFVELEPELRNIPRAMVTDLLDLDRPSESDDFVAHWTEIGQRFEDEWALLVAASESGSAARTQLARGAPFEDLNARSVALDVGSCVFD